MITMGGRVVNSEGGPAPQNVEVRSGQFTIEEARAMMQTLLEQQWLKLTNLLTLELVNARGGAPVINEPIVAEQVKNGPVSTHATMAKEGNNESKSHQGPEESEFWRNDEPRG